MRATGIRTDFPVSKLIELVVLIGMGIVAVAACASGQASKPASDLKTLPAAVDEQLNKAVATYLVISEKLANDTMDGVADQAKALAERLKLVAAVKVAGKEFGQAHAEVAAALAKAKVMAESVDISAARKAFADVSDEMVKLVERTGVPASLGGAYYRMHCPMYRQEKGGVIWMQQGDKARNPFWGKQMLTCADEKTQLAPAAVASGEAAASQPAGPAH